MKRPRHNQTQAGYETRDVAPHNVILAAVGLVTGVAVSAGFVIALVSALPQREAPAKPAIEAEEQKPPAPRLEIDGRADRAMIEDAAAQKLTGYAWVDRNAGTVRIPISRAMELLAQRGWPDSGGKP